MQPGKSHTILVDSSICRAHPTISTLHASLPALVSTSQCPIILFFFPLLKPTHSRNYRRVESAEYLPVPVLGLDVVGKGLGLDVRGVAVAVAVVVVCVAYTLITGQGV